jgi:hypothetical protein
VRYKYRAPAVVGVVLTAIAAAAFTPGTAHATPWSPIEPTLNNYVCVDSPGNDPWAHHGLVLANCNPGGVLPQEMQFYATPDSYGPGWYSIVLGNQTNGNYCVTVTQAANGKALEPYLCDGSQDQAWKMICANYGGDPNHQFTYPELYNATGYSMNDYGGHQAAPDPIASWIFENPAPDSLFFVGPTGISTYACTFAPIP